MKMLTIAQACTILHLEVKENTLAPLEEQAAPYLLANPFLVLDVGEVKFGSMQIGELVNLERKFEEHWNGSSHGIGIINLTEQGREVFATTKLDSVFSLYDSLADALEAFRKAGG